jgi:predicted DNA-binding protein (UPF0251 family)
MPRPRNLRRVLKKPGITYFKPAGVKIIDLQEVVLSVDEFEALRLKDFLEKNQKAAAAEMKISQPTFHRLARSARQKVAEAIVRGKAIRIEGGDYEIDDLIRRRGGHGFGRGRGGRRGPGR